MLSQASEYHDYLATPGWRARRDKAVARAGGRCQLCNSAKRLNVHHRTYERLGREQASDLTVLCEKCHQHFHGVTGGAERRLSAAPKPKKKPRLERHLRPLKAAASPIPRVPPPRQRTRNLVEQATRRLSPGPFSPKEVGQMVHKLDRKAKTGAVLVLTLEWLEQRGDIKRVGAQRWER